jgi:hypothetical protein
MSTWFLVRPAASGEPATPVEAHGGFRLLRGDARGECHTLAGGGRARLLGRPHPRAARAAPRWQAAAARAAPLALDDLDGSFAALCLDGAGRSWVATDRFASQLVYVARDAGGRVLGAGSEPARLARLCGLTGDDPRGVLQGLCFGYVPSARTRFAGVERLPYGSWLCLDDGVVTPHWRFGARAPSPIDEADALAAIAEAEDRAVERALAPGGRVVLLLSGGWDSRALLARLARLRPRDGVVALTFGPADSDDVVRARALAAAAGVPHVHRPLRYQDGAGGLAAWAARHAELSDNVFATLPDGPGLLDELPGDVLWLGTAACSTDLPLAPPPPGPRAGWLVPAIAKRALHPELLVDLGLLPAAARGEALAACDEVFAAHDRDAPGGPHGAFDRACHATIFQLWNLNRRLFETARPVATPLHDVDLVERYGELPIELRAQRRAHKLANERLVPGFADVPLHSRGVPTDYLAALGADPAQWRAVAEVVRADPTLGRRFDLDAVLDLERVSAPRRPAAAQVVLRLFVAALGAAAAR